MSRKIAFNRTNSGTFTAVCNNKSYMVAKDQPNYEAFKKAIIDDDPIALEAAVSVAKAVETFAQGKVEIKDNVVYYDGKVLNNGITERILTFIKEGLPFNHLGKFLEKMKQHYSQRTSQELYPFLEHKGLPITEDGCFLAYKRVRDDYTDVYSGTVNNSVGSVHQIERNEVDDDWRVDCSNGFHAGSIEYVRNYKPSDKMNGSLGHVMIVKIDPLDVISVPAGEVQKLRTCKYEVIAEYDNQLIDILPGALYTSEGERSASGNGGYGYQDDNDDEDDFEDFEQEDEDLDDDEFEDEEDDEEENDDSVDVSELVRQATDKGINPYQLAYKVGLSNEELPSIPSLQDVIQAMVDQDDGDLVKDAINGM